jgi:hypothetical protein
MKTAVARNFTFRLVWFFSNNTPDHSSLKARQDISSLSGMVKLAAPRLKTVCFNIPRF